MEFQSMINDHRNQITFYRRLCLGLIAALSFIAIVVPLTMSAGPYIVRDSENLYSVSKAQPWKLTVSRMEGFLRLYLSGRFDWTKENFGERKALLKEILSEPAFQKMKDSLLSLEILSKNQGARSFFILEGYQFSNERKIIEAKVSRVLRVGTTGVVTPLVVRIYFDDAAMTEKNPYGLRIKSLEEGEAASSVENKGSNE